MRNVTALRQTREKTRVFLYPSLPKNRPENTTAMPYPVDRNMKMALARAWLTINSSSKIGRMGENTILTEKFENQMNQRKRRKRSAFPRKSGYRSTNPI